MSRPLRIEYPGALYHVTSRGNERHEVFRDDRDREFFLNLLGRCCVRFHWLCHAYCLMKNHYHLIIETSDTTLSRGMRHLNGVYTQKFNWHHNRVGHVFQGRYKAVLIERETHLLEACRYVVLNPVRANTVSSPALWKWSSFRATCGEMPASNYLTTEWILQQFGDNSDSAVSEYRNFIKDGIGGRCLWDDLKHQTFLGGDEFVTLFCDAVEPFEDVIEIPKAQRLLPQPTLEQLFANDVYLRKRERDERIIEAIEKHGYTEKAVGDFLGLHSSRISRIFNGHREEK